MDYEKLGVRVRQQRVLNRLTQEQLAEKAGVSSSFIGHIERGEKKASVETVVALCNAMDISPSVLLQDSLSDAVLHSQLKLEKDHQEPRESLRHVRREHNQKTRDY